MRLVSFVATEKTNGRQLVHVCSVDIRPLCLSPSITGFCATGTGDASPAQGLRHRCKRGRLLPVTEPVKKITGLPSIPCSCTGNCRRKRRRNGVASNNHCRNQIAVNSDLDWVVSCFRLGPTSPCRNTAGVLTTAAAACRRRRRRNSAPCAVAVEVD